MKGKGKGKTVVDANGSTKPERDCADALTGLNGLPDPSSSNAVGSSINPTLKMRQRALDRSCSKATSSIKPKITKPINTSSALKKHKGESSSSSKVKKANRISSSTSKGKAVAVDVGEWTSEIRFCPTFHPSKEEFEHPLTYLKKIFDEGSEYGMCKIVAPVSPSVPAATTIKELLKSEKLEGAYLPLHIGFRINHDSRRYNFQEFQSMADKFYVRKYKQLGQLPALQMEKDFWKEVSIKDDGVVERGKGPNLSAFSIDPHDKLGSSRWNLKKFARLPESPLRFLENEIEGVTNPTLYMEMLWSYRNWHAEPGHLYRIDYHHYGDPRTWYGIPNTATSDFENVVRKFVFPQLKVGDCEAYDALNLKTMLFSPSVMVKRKFPIYKCVQNPGEFVITFPRSYHMGFSHGFNCSETVNFATRDWFWCGDDASDKRALYIRAQVVPYQQLLFKEVMDLYRNKKTELASPTYNLLKAQFCCFIRMHRYALSMMAMVRGGTSSSNKAGDSSTWCENMSCSRCGRECYLGYAYFKCHCYNSPMCIFHDIYKTCRCGNTPVVIVKDEFSELENMAKEFEEGKAGKKFMCLVKNLVELKFGLMCFGKSPALTAIRETEVINIGKSQDKGKGVMPIEVPKTKEDEVRWPLVQIPKKPRT